MHGQQANTAPGSTHTQTQTHTLHASKEHHPEEKVRSSGGGNGEELHVVPEPSARRARHSSSTVGVRSPPSRSRRSEARKKSMSELEFLELGLGVLHASASPLDAVQRVVDPELPQMLAELAVVEVPAAKEEEGEDEDEGEDDEYY